MLDVIIVWGEKGKVEKVIRVNEDGSFEEAQHRPWFVALRFMGAKGIVDYREVPLKFYVFSEKTWRYEKASDNSYIIYTETPSDVRRVATLYDDNGIPHALSNIRYKARVSLDLSDSLFGLKVPAILHYSLDELENVIRELIEKMKTVKVLGFDIEVEAKGSFPRPGDRVFIVSLCWDGLLDDSEECVVLEGDSVFEFMKHIEKVRPNYILGFVSNTFDIPYLTAYIKELQLTREGILTDTVAIPHIDLAEVLEQHGSGFGLPFGSRLALDDIAKKMALIKNVEELEIESSIDRNRIWLEYQNVREKVVRYAETDAKLTLRIGKEVLKTLLSLYLLTGISPSTIQVLPSFGSIAEYSVLDVVRRKYGKVYQVRSAKYTAKELIDGIAFYKKGTKEHFLREGLWENVAYLDFNMLYPTIYYSYKLDPEGVCIGNGFRIYLVDRDKDGDIAVKESIPIDVSFTGGDVYDVLRYFYEGRKVTKKIKKEFPGIDQAMKILANSAYGMFSKGRGGAVNEVLAGFIFFKSSHIFQSTLGIIKNMGLNYVYGATDSFFVLLNNIDPKELEEKLNRAIQSRFGSEFSIKFEGICRKFVLLKRKTYVCVLENDEGKEVLIKGMEKLELPQVVKDNLPEIFERVLNGEDWRKVIDEYMKSAGIRELFVKVSKRISDLYDEEERRFKNPNSNRTKAILVKYLYDEGQHLSGSGHLQFYFTDDSLPNTSVVAYYLNSNRSIAGKKAVMVLIDYDEGNATTYECGLVDYKSRRELSGTFFCVERRLSRSEVEELAKIKAGRVVDYLKQIETMTKQKKLL
ncbi:DNA polymerase B region [Ignisphaera aggregans DSM 17230]|uniref:DNA-directed DNA polymerase n=1 Tax=Ignisphaera aggregans (strain DSM 17230 / JCM 13409 / AQ1.S1) TaxID=583356 RepID=E0STH7_IGNAA|nr:DNA polymerase B region [Ignisphaera aggregans DSM 17230]